MGKKKKKENKIVSLVACKNEREECPYILATGGKQFCAKGDGIKCCYRGKIAQYKKK